MSADTQLSSKSIKQILTELDSEHRVISSLPGGGVLYLEDELPFLLIYRKHIKDPDLGTQRLVKSGASYLIVGTSEFEHYKDLIYAISDKLSVKFNSYLLLEIYSGPEDSTNFIIKGPSHKLPTTLNILKEELSKISSPAFGVHIDTEIKQTKIRQLEGDEPLIFIEDAKSSGSLYIGLEVPPVYRNNEGHLFPVFLRQFRDHFSISVQKAVFDYIRVQTSSGITSFDALGKREIHQEVFKIDKQLTQIESSYQFLLLVAPVNIQDIRKRFFESNFKELDDYHYRLLPVDPDLLKRKLFSLRIDEIDDPALSYLFSEKRDELDTQISMLKERGSPNFFYNSLRLYQKIDENLINEAKLVLENFPEDEKENEDEQINAREFSAMARKEFEYFQSQDNVFKSKIHLRKDVNVMMVSRGELYVPADYTLSRTSAEALIQHEIGTHVLTNYNGNKQPLSQLAVGLADYDPLQEGMAVLSEYLIGGLTANRLRILAGRVVAGAAVIDGKSFVEIFKLLFDEYKFSQESAFNVTSRIMQGGGFIKDIIYLKGLVQLVEYLKNGGEFKPLFAGKFALRHLPVIEELTKRGILNTPVLTPRYMELEGYEDKMNLIRDGLTLSQMIKK